MRVLRWSALALVLLAAPGWAQAPQALKGDAAARGAKDIPPNQTWIELGHNHDLTISIAAGGPTPYGAPGLPGDAPVKMQEGYFRLLFTASQPTADGDYDRVYTHDIFYCGQRRYALLETVYALGPKVIATVLRPAVIADGLKTYAAAPVTRGSVNDTAYQAACDIDDDPSDTPPGDTK